jgi:hypothetical protein
METASSNDVKQLTICACEKSGLIQATRLGTHEGPTIPWASGKMIEIVEILETVGGPFVSLQIFETNDVDLESAYVDALSAAIA